MLKGTASAWRRSRAAPVVALVAALVNLGCSSSSLPPCPALTTYGPEWRASVERQARTGVDCRVTERVFAALMAREPNTNIVFSPHAITRALVKIALTGTERQRTEIRRFLKY